MWVTLSVGNVCTHCSALWIYWKALRCSVMENTKRKHILHLYRQLYKHNENVLRQGLLILFSIHLQVFWIPKEQNQGMRKQSSQAMLCLRGCVYLCTGLYAPVCVSLKMLEVNLECLFSGSIFCFLTQDLLVLPGICQFDRLAGQWAPGLIPPQTPPS